MIALTVLGFAGRLLFSYVSVGSDDSRTWAWFGDLVMCTGLFRPYELEPTMNHPPIPAIWAAVARITSGITSVPFPFIFRLPAIAADIGSSILLYQIFKARTGDARWGWAAATGFAWNLSAIMVGAYHCNTDNICAFFTLWAAFRLAERKSPFTAGVALAAAINVKIVPLLLIPPLLAACGNWRGVLRFLGGLSLGLPPFLLMIAVVPHAFIHNVLGYNSMIGNWGLMFFVANAQYLPSISMRAAGWVAWFSMFGKYIVLGAVTAMGIAAAVLKRWNAYELGALGWALFLVLSPGFGWQYTVYVAPLLMAASLRAGLLYGLIAGLYTLSAYAFYWTGKLPLKSYFVGGDNPLPTYIGLVAWAILVKFVASTLLKRRGQEAGDRSQRSVSIPDASFLTPAS